jgi:hypothetical protein
VTSESFILYICNQLIKRSMKLQLKSILLLAIAVLFSAHTFGQFNGGGNYWKKHRTEFYLSLGASSFLGELGGRNAIGSNFVKDFELNQTRGLANVGIRYFLMKDLALRGNIMAGYLAGNDNLTEEPFRMKRNLHFRSFVTEVSGLLEYNYRIGAVGSQYKLNRSNRARATFTEAIYSLFIGVGVLKFNPQARFQEQWYDLRPMGTEGQNLGKPQNQYSLYTVIVPIGFNWRTSISERFSLSLEISHRFAFSDYIDDVSTEYYNQQEIELFSGVEAAHLADPSFEFLIIEGEQIFSANTLPGMQRGNPDDNDSYMTLTLGLNYKMETHKFKKRRRSVRSKRKGRRLFL